jgi:predicted HAD superfamily phosphohydrolase YqeG
MSLDMEVNADVDEGDHMIENSMIGDDLIGDMMGTALNGVETIGVDTSANDISGELNSMTHRTTELDDRQVLSLAHRV